MARQYVIVLSLCLLLSACTTARKTIGQRLGPTDPALVSVEPWTYQGAAAYRLTTAHYTIYTTLPDVDHAKQIAQIMEAGLAQYQQFVPGLALSREPMDCYIFATRSQWTDFTRRNTGALSHICLQISRGGYTLRDWFVAFDIGTLRTYSVAAHEGWHQFAFRNFIGRLPPFLEEGIACMFEDVKVKSGLPRFNLSVNPNRAQALRRAIESRRLIPLEKLVTLHAGEIVGRTGNMIDTFYAENWAFAKFLWEGEHGKYRPALLRLIADTADGQVYDPSGSHRKTIASWNPDAVLPLLEHYFGMNMAELSRHFQAYLHEIAYEEYQEQFAS